MQQNATPFEWTSQREDAAAMVAGDRQADDVIADKLGINRATLYRWKQEPEFAARVEEHRKAWREHVRNHGIADREARVRALNERWGLLQQVIQERALDEGMAGIPGGKSGLLVRQVKLVKVLAEALPGIIGSDGVLSPTKLTQEVAEYAVDTGLLAELRAHEKQAAQELGQWSEKREVSGDVLVRRYEGVNIDEV